MAKTGRPTKMTPQFIKAAEDVLSRGLTAIIFTDEELLDEINEQLPEDAQVAKRTFEDWKSGNFDDRTEEGRAFLRLIKNAIRLQKENLFSNLSKDKAGEWQKWAWIIERKFSDWNLKQISEISGRDGKPVEHSVKIDKTDLISDAID